MKRLALVLTVVGFAMWAAAKVEASHGYFAGYGSASRHAADHAGLAHRAEHRAIQHHNAHHYPMTWYGHGQLHADLNHEAVHDRIEPHSVHDAGVYARYYGYAPHGGALRTPIGSFWFHAKASAAHSTQR